ncbi:hypothetical protein Acry_1126 [Acidiphilium cryptum JF-5]|uniref:Uncharacterized protein n=1 Tax=Acidiphilium cryptum (strain JF-5) TaxID=349163 RepID=A5FXK6_ACICJ|nr:hypothetical protein Acry_1126 [Acidiphilium cryptum JF-5]
MTDHAPCSGFPYTRGVERRRDDVRIGAAAAEMAADGRPHLGVGRCRHGVEQGGAAHDHAGRAEAALQGVVRDERGLNRMEVVAARQPLDRRDPMPRGIDGEEHAGDDRLAVEPDGAGGTGAAIACDLGAGQAEHRAERIGEGRLRRDGEDVAGAVDREGDGDCAGAEHPPGIRGGRCRRGGTGHARGGGGQRRTAYERPSRNIVLHSAGSAARGCPERHPRGCRYWSWWIASAGGSRVDPCQGRSRAGAVRRRCAPCHREGEYARDAG